MQSLLEDLRGLKLHGMAEALPEILAKPRASGNSLDTVLRKLDRVTHHCEILETGNDSYRFKESQGARKRKTKSAK